MRREAAAQQRIRAWFDATYRSKGMRYLRPLRAYQVFPALLELTSSDALLDVACGPGLLLEAAASYTRQLDGCDLSAVAVRQARSRLPDARVLAANAEALPYASGTFDVVTCIASIERMLDRRQALRELWRVGSPEARYCFYVRNSGTRRWQLLRRTVARRAERGHPDADTLANWTDLFESVGFRVTRSLPDQYPLQRRRALRTLFKGPFDFRAVVESPAPIERARSFIFLLTKAS